ncbi:MAG: RsmD family RNA methyltransferase [Firmicutes bacterium]|nr:RsmD family RNA methyltransferase [Bacillota bacterium]
MRIIGGRFRGKKLEYISDELTRPTTDRVRENIFNIIGDKIKGATVLDLFSGSGAFAAEAISRGAKQVIANDVRPEAVAIIRKNAPDAEIHQLDYRPLIQHLAEAGRHIDIAFIDPPYGMKVDLPKADLIVYETDKSSPISFDQPVLVKQYGRALVYFIQN